VSVRLQEGDVLLTTSEVAEMLRVSRGWVTQHANGTRRPMLPSVRLGRAVRFNRADVLSFIRRHSTESTEAA
jgi:excisionase family DNA binding protein